MSIRGVDKEKAKEKPRPGKPQGEEKAKAGGTRDRAPRSSSAGRRDQLAGVEEKLTELLSSAALGQTTLGMMTNDQRHVIGGQVTGDFAAELSAAWVKLARSNSAVAGILIKLTQGSEMGEVMFVTVMFAFTQAQVYGAMPLTIPNPRLPDGVPVPPSEEVQAHEAMAPDRDAVIPTPPPVAETPVVDIGTRPPPPKGEAAPGSDDPEVTAQAEKDRKAVEARRRKRGS